MESIGNASENFDALGRFTKGTEMYKQIALENCLAMASQKGVDPAECYRKYNVPNPNDNSTPVNNQQENNTEEDNTETEAKYGGALLPFLSGYSAYPF